MKKLLYLLAFLPLISCERKNDPNPTPDPRFLASRQAPFGNNPVDIKLKKILRNGFPEAEYVYDGDAFVGEKRYTAESVSPYLSGTFTRKNNVADSYKVLLAPYDSESQSYSDTLIPYYSITYITPRTDSLQHVTRGDLSSSKTYTQYSFDSKGFVTRQEFWGDVTSNLSTAMVFIRNKQNNISTSWIKEPFSAKSGEVLYTYDNHPNPFFKLGMDWGGELSVRSLSPNNIVKETYVNGNITYSNIYYDYEYLPNGYPSKVKIRVESVNVPRYSYTFDFRY